MNKYDGMVEVVGAPIIVNKKGEILFVKSHKWGDKYIIYIMGEFLENYKKNLCGEFSSFKNSYKNGFEED